MDLDFEWCEAPGVVQIDCRVNDDAVGLGCFPDATSLPMCTATVDFPHLGCRSMLGWVQLVRLSDNATSGALFESDPFVLFGDAPSPYCWYGLNPTLFDGPSRSSRDDLDWEAHSFLATTPLDEVMALRTRRVVPLVGFSWAFNISHGQTEICPPRQLPLKRWSTHTSVLRATYQLWNFAEA